MHRFGYLAIFLLAIVFIFIGLGSYDLVSPDEPRFALIAREILQTDHWFLLQRNGNIYSEKPPFFFWCIAIISNIYGEVNSWTARLPSAIASLGILFLICRFAIEKEKMKYRVSILTGMVLLTSFLFYYEARMAQIDMLMCFFITGGFIECFYLMNNNRKSSIWAAIYMGLGTITKGPIAFILPLGASVLYQLLSEKKFKSLPYKAIIFSSIIPITWMVFLYIESINLGKPDYLHSMVFRQTVERYLDPWHHYQPWYYFIVTTSYDLLPWVLVLWLSAYYAINRWANLSTKEKYAWCVCIFTIVFFSISSGKRNIYILPMYPFAAYIVALYFEKQISEFQFSKSLRIIMNILFIALLTVGFILIMLGLKIINMPIKNTAELQIPYLLINLTGMTLFVFSFAGLIAVYKKYLIPSILILILLTMQINIVFYQNIKPSVETITSARFFMIEIEKILEKSNIEPVVGMVDFREGFRFYGHRDIIELEANPDKGKSKIISVEDFWHKNPNGWLIITDKNWSECVKNFKLKGILRYEQKVGSKTYYLLQQNYLFIN